VGLVTWKRQSFGHRAQFAVSEFSVNVKNNSIFLSQQTHYENPAIRVKKKRAHHAPSNRFTPATNFSALCRSNRNRLIQPELQQRFAGHSHRTPARKYFCARARRASNSCADRRARATAGNSADDRAHDRPTAHFLGGVAAAPFTLHGVVAAHYWKFPAIDDDACKFQLQFRTSRQAACFFGVSQPHKSITATPRH
jgi:hypothetical protein